MNLGRPGALNDLPTPTADGQWVSERISRLVEVIREYSPRLDVKWIPKAQSTDINSPQFVVVERLGDGREEPVFFIKNEQEFDGRVLERIILSDNKRANVLTELEAHEEAVKLLYRKMAEDQMAEANDIAVHALRSPKHDYSFRSPQDGRLIRTDRDGQKIIQGVDIRMKD